ncbi:MAG: MFS transporter [Deltaproteobacteria bacterium]|nr:MFS transporter [Deltaproteobacteria bacterium]
MTEALSQVSSRPPLTFREKLCYGLGDVSNGLASSSVGLWFLYYLTDVAGLASLYAGIAIMIGRAWDAVTDPLMGWIADHTNSRWGKRRPYLLFGCIPYAISFFALWVVPDFHNEVLVFAYITVALIIFNTCLTVVFVPYTSLTAAITDDYHERTSLTGFRMTSAQAAYLAGAAIPSSLVPWILSPNGEALLQATGIYALFGSWAGTPRSGYFLTALILSAIMVPSILATFFGTQERDTGRASMPQLNQTPLTYASSILDQLQGNKPFRSSVAIFILTNCAATLIAVNLPFYVEYVLDLEKYRTNIIMLLFVTAILSMPVWVMITKRFGKSETYSIAVLLFAAMLCLLPLIEARELSTAYLMAVVMGFFYAAAQMIPWAIMPDVVEYDELRTGHRREGLFYGGTTFSYKLATALAIFLSGLYLGMIGYVPNVAQSSHTIAGIKAIIGPIPAFIFLMGVFVARKHPLTAKKHAQIRQELAQRYKDQQKSE